MSLMKSLARVAAGVALAKGLGTVMQNRQRQSRGQADIGQAGTGAPQGGGMLDSLFGNNTGPNAGAGAAGGLGGLMDRLGQQGGGIGDLLGRLSGGQGGQSGQGGRGGISDLLGGMLGGAAAGGLASKGSQASNNSTFGQLFDEAIAKDGEPEVAPTPEQNAVAGLMLRAMIQAAKSDGRIDDTEKERLLSHMGDLDAEEQEFIREQMAAPVDADALARDVPDGLQHQVYLMSLMAIDLDHDDEARYLDQLARGLGIDRAKANEIHDEVGAKRLYD